EETVDSRQERLTLSHSLAIVEIDSRVMLILDTGAAVDRDERDPELGDRIAQFIRNALVVMSDEDESIECSGAHVVNTAQRVGFIEQRDSESLGPQAPRQPLDDRGVPREGERLGEDGPDRAARTRLQRPRYSVRDVPEFAGCLAHTLSRRLREAYGAGVIQRV